MKSLLVPHRRRKIQQPFGWIPLSLVHNCHRPLALTSYASQPAVRYASSAGVAPSRGPGRVEIRLHRSGIRIGAAGDLGVFTNYLRLPAAPRPCISCRSTADRRCNASVTFWLRLASEDCINVPWSNKDLEVSLSSFRSKLEPGAEETWTIQIKGPEAENVAEELVATLYDASLDLFLIHNWSGLGHIFRLDYTSLSIGFANKVSYPKSRTYDEFLEIFI